MQIAGSTISPNSAGIPAEMRKWYLCCSQLHPCPKQQGPPAGRLPRPLYAGGKAWSVNWLEGAWSRTQPVPLHTRGCMFRTGRETQIPINASFKGLFYYLTGKLDNPRSGGDEGWAQSSSSSSPAPAPPWPFLAFFLFTRPGRPPPYGERREKSMCFWESRRTMKDGMFTTCFRTLEVRTAGEGWGGQDPSGRGHYCSLLGLRLAAAPPTARVRLPLQHPCVLSGEL